MSFTKDELQQEVYALTARAEMAEANLAIVELQKEAYRLAMGDSERTCQQQAERALKSEILNAKLLAALKTIARYDHRADGTIESFGEGICPFGCDCPAIAQSAIAEAEGRAS